MNWVTQSVNYWLPMDNHNLWQVSFADHGDESIAFEFTIYQHEGHLYPAILISPCVNFSTTRTITFRVTVSRFLPDDTEVHNVQVFTFSIAPNTDTLAVMDDVLLHDGTTSLAVALTHQIYKGGSNYASFVSLMLYKPIVAALIKDTH